MIRNFQEMQRLTEKPVPVPQFGTALSQISVGGTSLIRFSDGSVSNKVYKNVSGLTVYNGNRVRLSKISGTFVITERL